MIPDIFVQYALTFGWAMTGAISMAVALILMVKLFSAYISPIDEWKLIKEGNIAVAIVMGSVILGTALVVAHIVTA